MNIGYACLTLGVLNTKFKSCRLKNASEARLLELIAFNLKSLHNIIDYNIKNEIKLYRISSNLIPFASHPVNKIAWWQIFAKEFDNIGKKIKKSAMRVSLHPGQYTVLNSLDNEVVKRGIKDLNYHNMVLDSLNLSREHKIILHIGGVYNNKKEAIKRFITNYQNLDEKVKERIVLENDDQSYNISEVLEIAALLKCPVVFDNLHNRINLSSENKNESAWIKECKKTWLKKDGKQKIHYSQKDEEKKEGAHSASIELNIFKDFYQQLEDKDVDLMLEVKDKNLSAIKCLNYLREDKSIKYLEVEWSKYKYLILEKSPNHYEKIRKLLKNKNDYPVFSFYQLLEEGLNKESSKGDRINAALHVWGYFKKLADKKEKNKFLQTIKEYKQDKKTIKSIKNILKKLAFKYEQSYLLESYYFWERK